MEKLEELSRLVNRSKGQELFLFNLLSGDFEKLKRLEVQIKNCFVMYCPDSLEEVEEIMSMVPKSSWFVL